MTTDGTIYHDEITIAPMSILQDMQAIRPCLNTYIERNLTNDDVTSNSVLVLIGSMNSAKLYFVLLVYPRLKSYYAFIASQEKSADTLFARCGAGFKTKVVWKEFLEATRDLQGNDFGHFLSKHLTDKLS